MTRLPLFRAVFAAAFLTSALTRPVPGQDVTTPFPILFVTQVPVPDDFVTIGSTFGNHRGTVDSVSRGGDLWIRYPTGALRNLTATAGLGNAGFQGASSIAVRDPCVHWSGTRALFAMVVGASLQQYQHTTQFWRLYEIAGLGPTDTPVITPVANQPANCNNVSPAYGSDGRILFTSDRSRDGSAHLYPQRDEYEVTPIVSGLWSLDPASGDLRLLNHAPSGDFTPIVDSFGRVLFTQWDHLQRDQLADIDHATPTYGMFNWSNESAAAVPTPSVAEVFPEPRPSRTDLLAGTNMRGLLFNHFFPWQIQQDGTGIETLNHIGRHELHDYFDFALNGDPNLRDFNAPQGRPTILNFFHVAEDPLQAGRYLGTNAPEFYSHSAGQLVALFAPPGRNPDQITVVHLTHPETRTQTTTPSPQHSGQYRNPLPLSDGALIAAHTPYTGATTNTGTTAAPQTPFHFRLRKLVQSGSYLAAGPTLTGGITKSVSWWTPDVLASYSGPLWELSPVEVRPRPVPPGSSEPLPTPEQNAFAQAGVTPARLQQFLRERQLALIVSRNVTTRDRNDKQQPYNLRVAGTTTQTIGAPGQAYDISHLQLMQGDLLRGIGGTTNPRPGRRVLAQPLHDPAALAAMPGATGGPAGSVAIAADGSMAAFVPAARALSWQLTAPNGAPVVRERYWLTFQPGEIRVCASCHGLNTADQANQPEPTNTPQALVELLRHWQASTGPVLAGIAAGNVGGSTGPTNVLTINGSHGGPGRRVDLGLGEPFTLQVDTPPGGPTNAPFALWGRIGVPSPAEQLPTAFGTLLFPPQFLAPGNPLLLTVGNGLFADPQALVAVTGTPWNLGVPGLGMPLQLTLQGAMFDALAPFGLAVTNGVLLRCQ